MTKQLYEEALADVKKLKEVAEDNAKRALLEAVTPRIRDLIEHQLMGELPADPDKILTDEEEALGGFPEEEGLPAMPVPGLGDADASAAAISMPDEEGKVTLDLDALRVGDTDEYELSMESAKALGMLIGSSGKNKIRVFETKVRAMVRRVKALSSAGKIIRESKGYSDTISSVISEVEDTYSYLQEHLQSSPKKKRYEAVLESIYATLNQLTEQKMIKRNRSRTLSEGELELKLTGLPDEAVAAIGDADPGVDLVIPGEGEGEEGEEGGDELDLDTDEEGGEGEGEEGEEGGDELDLSDLGGDEDEDEEGSEDKMESRRMGDNVVVEIDEGMLRREISRMKTLREEALPSVKGHGPGKVAKGFEDDDLGDPFVDIDLTTESQDKDDDGKPADLDELDQLDQDADLDELDQDADLDEAEDVKQYGGRGGRDLEQINKQSRQPGMSEASLRRRLRTESQIQLEAKKKATQAKQQQKKSQQESQQQAKKGQKKGAQAKKQQAKKMQEAYVFWARRFNESVVRSRRLRGMLNEAARKGRLVNEASTRTAAESTNLRNKLAETNLFNAKLLFTNKLLQNEALTKRQKAEVIERLDEARSEREVRLVYESLVKTLQGTRKLTETVDRGVIGSSSRPARPAAATLNEGFEADRWARLAGIVK